MNMLKKNLNPSSVVAYDRSYKILRWSMAFLTILMFLAILGFASVTNVEEHKTMLVGHSSIGILISILILIRITKRFIRKDPKPLQDIKNWQRIAANIVQSALYFCMIFVPITGYLTARLHELPVKAFATFNLSQTSPDNYDQAAFNLIRQAHEIGIYLFMSLLVLHIGAALYHRLILKDSVFSTMTTQKNS